jgi:hypothetical protein
MGSFSNNWTTAANGLQKPKPGVTKLAATASKLLTERTLLERDFTLPRGHG